MTKSPMHANPFPDDYMPTSDEIAERVRERFSNGNPMCTNEDGNCLYRDDIDKPTNSCGVGYLLPDSTSRHILETTKWRIGNVICKWPDEIPKWMHEHSEFLHKIQLLHDKNENWADDVFMNHNRLNKIIETYL